MPERLLRTKEVASYLDVNVTTVSRWCRQGLIKSVRLGTLPHSPLRIPESALKLAISQGLGAEAIVTERELKEQK
jgi:excisionase family DNA binding protein